MKKIIIASKNPVKINAVKIAFYQMFPNEIYEYNGISTESNVSEQPISNKETFNGAYNRAFNAKKNQPDADYWIGIEGGIEKNDCEMESFAWVYILSEKLYGKAKTSSFFLPQKIVSLINSGMELSEADDMIFKQKDSKKKNGAIGILTGDVIKRTQYYSQAVILALIPFKNRDLYSK